MVPTSAMVASGQCATGGPSRARARAHFFFAAFFVDFFTVFFTAFGFGDFAGDLHNSAQLNPQQRFTGHVKCPVTFCSESCISAQYAESAYRCTEMLVQG